VASHLEALMNGKKLKKKTTKSKSNKTWKNKENTHTLYRKTKAKGMLKGYSPLNNFQSQKKCTSRNGSKQLGQGR